MFWIPLRSPFGVGGGRSTNDTSNNHSNNIIHNNNKSVQKMMIRRMNVQIKITKMIVLALMVILSIVVMKPTTTTLIFLTNSTTSTVVNAYYVIQPIISYNNHYIRSSTIRLAALNLLHHHPQRQQQRKHQLDAMVANTHRITRHSISRNDMIQSILMFGITCIITKNANAIDIQPSKVSSPPSSLSSFTLASESTTAASIVTGTKQDPKYEACLSQCMYTCTKPKGYEQKSRAECLPDCKQQCATTKQQLMIGTPIAK
jgi:hypothetical protein